MTTPPPLLVDLFCGAGGMSLGFEQAGFSPAAAVEIDPVHAATHLRNFASTPVLCADVAALSGRELRERTGIGDHEVHTVCGGAPCQGFSLIGKRAVDDPRNSLIGQFARMVAELRPRYFVLENVSGLLSGSHRRHAADFAEHMSSCGYTVLDPRILDATAFGVPQKRRRVFLIGARDDVPVPRYPDPTTVTANIRPPHPSPTPELAPCPTVRQVLSDLPDVDSEYVDGDLMAHQARLRYDNGCSPIRVTESPLLSGCAPTTHTETVRARFAATPAGAVEPVSRFLRLHPFGVCNTLRAGSGSDHGSHTAPRPIHPEHPRVITVREAARLHGYPDWFAFHATKWHGFRQVGNSVPPPLARAVAAELLRADGIVGSWPSGILACEEGLRHCNVEQARAELSRRGMVVS